MLQEFNYNNAFHKELLLKIIKDPTINEYLNRVDIIGLIESKGIRKYVLAIDGQCVGIGFIIPLRNREAEIRYCIEKNYRGNHYSNILVQKLLEMIEKGYTVYADIQSSNYASKATAISNGFTSEDDFVFKIKR